MSTQTPLAAPVQGTASTPVSAPAPAAATAPSVHVRAVITWLAIFPLVAIGMTALAPLTGDWRPALRALVLTLLVVPTAVYFVVPRLLAAYGSLMRRQASKR
ncbi:hypothetical protein [Arthrobacter sp. NyZ413]|uniref:hypothetical protein n=1 Tax=Arthrobacter sp. NyZ413 TaxID=3144669 RepID=UPI003BF7EE76